jgi:exodeoxyribonuclease V
MWSPQQEATISKVAKWIKNPNGQQVFRLFGYAGTGKTTIAKHLAEGVDGEVKFAAFTGKAALVLRQKGCPATTIHSLIYTSRDKGKQKIKELEDTLASLKGDLARQGLNQIQIQEHIRVIDLEKLIKEENANLSQPHFVKNLDSELKNASLLIIDEVSMVDKRMGEDLISFGKPILVLGDPAQLPPIKSAGYFTEGVKPDVMLTEIHRQAQESGILRFATDLRMGRDFRGNKYGDDCIIMNKRNVNSELVVRPNQIIVGRNRTRSAYNSRLREILGLVESGFDFPLPVAEDKLVCLKNNHEAGLLNGALFRVVDVGSVYDDKIAMEVVPEGEDFSQTISSHIHHFEGRGDDLPYWQKKEAEEFDYGYAMTCHKSQGSQWDHVMVFDESASFGINWNKWAYTAATRAAQKLEWVVE